MGDVSLPKSHKLGWGRNKLKSISKIGKIGVYPPPIIENLRVLPENSRKQERVF